MYCTRTRGMLFLIIFVCSLFSCVGRESTHEAHDTNEVPTSSEAVSLPSSTPTPTSQILPTRTLDLIRPDTVRATFAAQATLNAGRPKSTPRPSPTPTLSPKQLCQPFPDDMRYLGSTRTLGYAAWTIQAKCRGEKTYFRSPVGDMTFFDYTALTGRIAYGPPDPEEGGLWIYDYWLGYSDKWLNEKVSKVEWAAGKDAQDVQLLTILDHDGTLSIASGPFQIKPIAADVTHFAIAPTSDRLAYVKQEVLYVIHIKGGQPRKLAEGVYGTPVWALEENAIIFPSSPIKFANLDGSGSFIPEQLAYISKAAYFSCIGDNTCLSSNPNPAKKILWDEENKILVFHTGKLDENDPYLRTLYVIELSKDLQSIVNKQIIIGDFEHDIEWEIPGEILIDRSGDRIRITPAQDIFTSQARITSVSEQSLGVEFVWINSRGKSGFTYQFSEMMLSDLTQFTDIHGNSISQDDITEGMTVEFSARRLSPNTLSLFAYKIQIECDQKPCYLGIEGRS